ncbi:MAG: hypothetical protein JG782_97 [Anaerophaga sp.]|nr:hypothetical protein [Anaerophaga sp.]
MKKVVFTIFAIAAFLTQGIVNAQEKNEDYVKFGGAVRYNIHDKSWNGDKTDPQFTWDTWRLNVNARTVGVDLSFEYRFYPVDNTHFIHHGWLGYGFSDDLYMKLGVSQVPFGITQYASHSWWFQIPYYVGLEDDYDMGIKFDYTGIENLELNFAYYHQPEPKGSPNYASRYSYDITPSEDASLKEVNQFNVRAAYDVSESLELGLSGQFGKNYNSVLDESESSNAFAAHLVGNFGNFNFKGEYISYDFGAKDNEGNDLDMVQMGAYSYNYNVASEGDIWVAGLAYSIPVEWGPISNIQPYVDYSVINKAEDNFESSQHLVPGMLITAGSIYTYVDWAFGKNNAWLGPDISDEEGNVVYSTWSSGLAEGLEDADWESRFNINIGYYF